jgi:hypothetical protein
MQDSFDRKFDGINPFMDSEDNTVEKVSWSSNKVYQLIEALDNGYKPKGSMPFFDGNPMLKKANIPFEYTEEEEEELLKCMHDIEHFADNYCTVMTDEGLDSITLRDYQRDMLNNYTDPDKRFNVVLAARQIGKTITAAIYIAHYLIFNWDKNCLLLSNKGKTTSEIIDKVKQIFLNLPFFMKPGVMNWGVMDVKFDNGCRLIGQSTTKNAGIGYTIHLLYIDEFAHIQDSFVNSFWENVYPTISSSKVSRVVLTSTPNGFNKFHQIYTGAQKGTNEFHPYEVNWWQVPGRDDNWKKQEVENLGSEEAFMRQYGNQFSSSSSLLLEATDFKRMEQRLIDYETLQIPELDDINIKYQNFLKWSPEFDPENFRNPEKFYLFSIDIAEGNGGDYSIINMFEIKAMDIKYMKKLRSVDSYRGFYQLEQIGVFRSNEHVIEDFAKIAYTLIVDVFDQENSKILMEWNTYGGEMLKFLMSVFPRRNDFDEENIVKFKHRNDARVKKAGIKIKNDNKVVLCQNFAKRVRQDRIKINHKETYLECKSFGKNSKGSYEALKDNDDLIMSCIIASEFLSTVEFSDIVEEVHEYTEKEKMKFIIESLDLDDDQDDAMHFDIYDLVNDVKDHKFNPNNEDIEKSMFDF